MQDLISVEDGGKNDDYRWRMGWCDIHKMCIKPERMTEGRMSGGRRENKDGYNRKQ